MADPRPKPEYLGTGRRKTSVARVRVREGKGQFMVNDRKVDEYFTEERDRSLIQAPLVLCDLRNRMDVRVNVQGGGYTGQAGAICQGLARALKTMFGGDKEAAAADGEAGSSGMIKKLRDSGFLTRDGRMKERKKYGKKGARKSFQFSKR
ncbi:MAG TPA: 30S ribosomal protein S9 [Gemmataceae bacterium]|jgi:small subunit ribosomal protein S9|nr:30S ribosomal protein S9 [Gemmataceae bacterium]